jgi:peptidoglycan/xylan/chitin deacetylase (PgdA/CDA1 family)
MLSELKNGARRWLRKALAAANGVGVGAVLRRLGLARGGAIVMTHCVGHVPETAYLPADMKTSEAKVEALLVALKRRGIRVVTVRELASALARGEAATDLVAFSMDDGYRDNLTIAMPLLAKHGAGGTVYVETGVVGSRTVSWMHRYFYVAHAKGEEFFAREYMARTREPKVKELLEKAAASGHVLGALYAFKRVLKYEADFADRERVTTEILGSIGVRDQDIAKSYLTWDEVAALDRGGVELGAHTVHHEILSRLDAAAQRREIEESTRVLRERVKQPVDTFAYPFGRKWDYDENCLRVLDELGYSAACAAMEGTNDPRTPRYELNRLALNDDTSLSELLAELDGTFHLARRVLRVRI